MNRFEVMRFFCRVLSPEKCNSGEELIDEVKNIGDWVPVIQHASEFLITPALSSALHKKKLINKTPQDVQDYFEGVSELNRNRNQNLEEQTVAVSKSLNSIGVEPLLLKGMANYTTGVYDDPSLRTMSDIDILIPQEKMSESVGLLKKEGYIADIEIDEREDHLHASPMYHKEYEAYVELHSDAAKNEHKNIVVTSEMWRDSEARDLKGAAVRVPSIDHMILHNIVHGHLQHGIVDNQYYQQMYDLVIMRHKNEHKIDWALIYQKFRDGRHLRGMKNYLILTEKLFAQNRPETIVKTSPIYEKYLLMKVFRFSVLNKPFRDFLTTYFYFGNMLAGFLSSPRKGYKFSKLLSKEFYLRQIDNVGKGTKK